MIKQVQANYNPPDLEKRVQKFWNDTDAYKKMKAFRASGADFYFVDGPPYTTGYIHLGTALNKTIKDTVVRYKRMQRFNVRDQPGYDMHGLPIEVKVEQAIGIKSKKDIESYGMERFVNTCKEFALNFQSKMTEQFKELGVWMDWERPYMTIAPEYIEAAWWTLKRAHEKDLLVSANRVISWCPRCETALAEAEIEYSEVKDPSIYVKFPLKGETGVSLLIWTTTPWTLPANMAVAAHPDFRYAMVRYVKGGNSDTVVVLESLIDQIGQLEGWEEYEVIRLIEGDDLVGMEYVPPLLDEVESQRGMQGKWVHKVIPSKTVEADMTGLVHIAPGHGPEDFELGREFGLEPYCPVDEGGRFTPDVGQRYRGMHVKKANPQIMQDLTDKGLMFHQGTVEHRYGHCWRCNSGILFRNTNQWYLRITQVKDLMLDEIAKVRWTPEWAGSSREYDWTMNARDWCISRQRYWGIPLPVWTCESGHMKVVGSTDELKAGEGYKEGMDLHRPWIDGVTFTCEKCGQKMKRVGDVLDVWFDAGVCSWAQLGYPREKKEFDRWWPARFITEAHDQTRGWFYSQLGSSVISFGHAPYDNVLMHGWMLDPQGQPMSKSKGNVIEPVKVISEFGADAMRFYFMRVSAPWEDISFQHEGVKNARKMLNILWNVVNFASTYMSIDKFERLTVDPQAVRSALRPEDRWLMSRSEKLKLEVTKDLESYDLHKACRALEEFILEDMSRWYVRLIRDRMWTESTDMDKVAAYVTLYDALMSSVKLLAPFCPHITEEIYQALDGSLGSVHMTDWPAADISLIDDTLEASMATMQELVEEITKERQKKNVKLRWPLKRIVIQPRSKETLDLLRPMEEVLLSQANVKIVEYVPPGQTWHELELEVVPNPNAIGKVYRQWSAKIAVMLKSRPAAKVKEAIENGECSLGIEGQMVRIEPSMVSFSTTLPEDVVDVEFADGELFIDFNITPEIEAEGYTRELIRRIQQMRKDMKLDVEEFVRVEVKAPSPIEGYLQAWREHIKKETRSLHLDFVADPQGERVASWEVEKHDLVVAVSSLRLKEGVKNFSVVPGLSQDASLALLKAGKGSVDDLKGMDEASLSAIEGISKADARNLVNYLNRRGLPEKQEAKVSPPDDRAKVISYLMRVPRMNQLKAEMLYDAGYDSVDKISRASADDLRSVSGLGAKTVQGIMDHAAAGGFTRVTQCGQCKHAIQPYEAECPSCHCPVEVEREPAKEEEEEPRKPGTGSTLEPTLTYLIKEEKGDRSYRLFTEALSNGMKGFCVTRDYPLKIRSKYSLGDTPMIWLSNIGKENSLRPKDLEKLSFSLEQFLSNQGGIILLDGLEYLITNNNFLTVLRFIQSLRDQVAINKSILMLAVNPSTLDPHELNLLEKEVDVAF
ncbi:MAG: isoleucine--tRNA ligase [Methanomassiliicoccus sp.]|nr:isoleucine--tRNA ligase [Methanomassiliicoccus sp.]